MNCPRCDFILASNFKECPRCDYQLPSSEIKKSKKDHKVFSFFKKSQKPEEQQKPEPDFSDIVDVLQKHLQVEPVKTPEIPPAIMFSAFKSSGAQTKVEQPPTSPIEEAIPEQIIPEQKIPGQEIPEQEIVLDQDSDDDLLSALTSEPLADLTIQSFENEKVTDDSDLDSLLKEFESGLKD